MTTRYQALLRDGRVEVRRGEVVGSRIAPPDWMNPEPRPLVTLRIEDGDVEPYLNTVKECTWEFDWHATPAEALAAIRAKTVERVEEFRRARAELAAIDAYQIPKEDA